MKLATLTFLTTLAAATGCAEHTQPSMEFPAEASVRPPQRMAQVQQANGARADGNLYGAHFTDGALNSLGRSKLDMMLRDEESIRPLTVHLAPAPDRDALLKRIESVTAYLKDNGLNEQQMRFVSTLNEDAYFPSAIELANLRRMRDDTEPAEAPPMEDRPDGSAGGFQIR